MNHADATRFLKDHIIVVKDFEAGNAAINPEDGTIVDDAVLVLHDFNLGDNEAKNVKVIVRKGLTSPFFVGEDFLKKQFGNFTVDKVQKAIIFEK